MPIRYPLIAIPLLAASPVAAQQSDLRPIQTIELPPSTPDPSTLPQDDAVEGVAETAPAEDTATNDSPVEEPRLDLDLSSFGDGRTVAAVGDTSAPAGTINAAAAAAAIERIEAAAALRAANAEQLAAQQQQLDAIAAEQRAQRDRIERHREAEAAHRSAMADYEAQLEASRAAQARWEADVAACRAGDRLRCAVPETAR